MQFYEKVWFLTIQRTHHMLLLTSPILLPLGYDGK